MESKEELKEIDIQNRTCLYFDEILNLVISYSMKNYIKKNTNIF